MTEYLSDKYFIMLLIFDLDGTLVDCKKLHQQAFRYAVMQQDSTLQYTDEELEGLPTFDKIITLQQKGFKITKEIDLIKRNWTRQHIHEYIKYDPELSNIIKTLDNKYSMTVCSNSRNEFILKCLQILDLWQFELIYSRDHGIPKPDPWMFNECIRITK